MHRPNEPEQVDASAARQIQPSDHSAGYDGAREGKAWGRPFVLIDKVWTKFEVGLCTFVLLSEVVALGLWVGLKGMSTGPGGSVAGIVLRAILGAIVLGSLAYWATGRQKPVVRHTASISGVLLGVVLARAWASVGVDWSSNLLNWYQQASTLTLVGGLRGVGTRLTLLLALLGGSLATAAGKHITIDLVTRYVSPRIRTAAAIGTWLISSAVCFSLSWGYFDHIAIENFEAKLDAKAADKFKAVGHGISEYAFATKNQIKLDLKTFPRVIRGESYSGWLTGTEWNDFLDHSGYVERYGKADVETLRIPPESTRSPMIVIPHRGEPRGGLTDAANLVFPIGFLIIGLRFLLLSVLTLSGHMKVDPEAHMDLGTKKHEPDPLES
ncbi:MAG TPA: TRAP transporter small permease subunit [Polyangiaceae bacterium]|nr:TRAP transporter small permease subunit [Polyangiaceae bacterium]